MDTRTGEDLDPARGPDHLIEDEKLARLSSKEHTILLLVADGMTNKEIGSELWMGEKTVKRNVSNILSKLGVARRAAAAAYLVRRTSQHQEL